MSRAWLRSTVSVLLHRWAVRSLDWAGTTLWALDLETGGLDPKTDPILSVGMVPVREGAVALGDAFHALVRPDRAIGQASLAIHHILPGELEDAPAPEHVLGEVRGRIDEGVVLVHQRTVDVPFLVHGYRSLGQEPPTFAVVDTVDLLLRYARRQGLVTMEQTRFSTGLAEGRARFGLPPHTAHDALSDAIATAELFLVLAHRLDARRLGHLL